MNKTPHSGWSCDRRCKTFLRRNFKGSFTFVKIRAKPLKRISA
jgi:hypothetical protein